MACDADAVEQNRESRGVGRPGPRPSRPSRGRSCTSARCPGRGPRPHGFRGRLLRRGFFYRRIAAAVSQRSVAWRGVAWRGVA